MNRNAVELERDQLIRALQARERFLDAILGSLETFFTVDEDWRVTFVNKAAAAMAGMSADEMLGRSLWELDDAGVHKESSAELLRAMEARVSVEYEVTSADGGAYHGKAYPLADGGLAVYVRDVSERAQAEAARADAERRYRDLVQSVNSAIVRWTGDGTLTFMNEYAERLFGWSSAEVLGRQVSLLLPPQEDDEDRLPRLVDDIIAHPERYSSNVNENICKDGSRLWVAWTNRVVLDDRGEVREVLAVGNDVTELVTAQSALRESEERFRTLADHSPFLIWVTDVDGRVEFVNRTYRDFFGVNDDDIRETGWAPLLHADDVDRYAAELADALRARRPFAAEARVRAASGEWRWIDSHAVPRFSSSGACLGMVGSSVDITDRKRSEQALRETEAEKAAQQERERLARDLHDSVTQALFAANLKAEALSLSNGPVAAEALEELQRLNRGALAQMRTLVVELRDGTVEEVPIQQLLRNVVEATQSRTSIAVRLDVTGDANLPPEVHTTLYRVAQEALNNAARHSRARKAWLKLELGSARVHLVVGDDGRGFDASPMDGTHVGLASMRERAAEVGAQLSIETGAGKGTVVTLDWVPGG